MRTRVLIPLIGALALAGCEHQVLDPGPTGTTDEVLFAKGGKPGGGGNPPSPPNPVIAFSDIWTLWVTDEDGSNKTAVLSEGEGVSLRDPSWAPYGDGTLADPWRLVFTRLMTAEGTVSLATLDIDTIGGVVNARNLQDINLPPYAADPNWGPAGEVSYVTEVLVPGTGLMHSAIYVISAANLPNPIPIELYVAEADNQVHEAVWSPSGDALAFVEQHDSEKKLTIVQRSTGALTTVVDYGQLQILGNFGIDWSKTPSNPSYLAFVEDKPGKGRGPKTAVHRLQVTDFNGDYVIGGQDVLLATGFVFPTWSSDDAMLLASDQKYLKALNAATGSVLGTLTRTGNNTLLSESDWRRF